MKNLTKIGLFVLATLVAACSKSDYAPGPIPPDAKDPDPQLENQAPGAFGLLEVADLDTEVALTPTFRWNSATDPDGDVVSYSLLLGEDVDQFEEIATDLNTTIYEFANRLSYFNDYFWQVKAKDEKGKETTSETFSFTTRNLNVPEEAATSKAIFSERSGHTVTFFKDKLWLLGGEDNDEIKVVDLFSSADGINWLEGKEMGIGRLTNHSAIAHSDTLWLFGGKESELSLNPWMYYTTSEDQTMIGFEAPWPERQGHTTEIFKDKIWVLGGRDSQGKPLNDVWSTEDVKTWNPDGGTTANWEGRYGHSSVVFDDKLWVIGGSDGSKPVNEVWYTDGSTTSDGTLKWVFVPQENAFPSRSFHQTVVFDNKIWLFGGFSDSADDIWYTEDGANWVLLTTLAPTRAKHSLTVFKNKLLMVGGQDDFPLYKNDVWVFD